MLICTWDEYQAFQSTHPVRGTTLDGSDSLVSAKFQSTHPVRGATSHVLGFFLFIHISIHAPREGCDSRQRVSACMCCHFNPRTP